MVDKEQMKKTAAKVLGCVEKVSSFASSIDPLFGVVSSLAGVVRTGMVDEEDHALEKDFREIHDKLESISMRNKNTLQQICIIEVNETFGKYEEYIKHQYVAFSTMVDRVKKDPGHSIRHMKDYEKIYERDKSDLSLNVYYRGVMGTDAIFGRPLLRVYLQHCNHDRRVIEHRCSHLAHLFYLGLISLMAYTSVTEEDEDEVRDKWAPRMADIEAKMREALGQCKED